MRKAFDVYFRRGAAWRSLKYGGLCRRTCNGIPPASSRQGTGRPAFYCAGNGGDAARRLPLLRACGAGKRPVRRRSRPCSSSSRARAGSMRLSVCAVERLPRRMSLYGVRRRGLQHTEKIQRKPKIRRRFSPDFFISPNLLLYTKNILL